jgi:hypothetical protein
MYSLIHQGYAASDGEFDPEEIKTRFRLLVIFALSTQSVFQDGGTNAECIPQRLERFSDWCRGKAWTLCGFFPMKKPQGKQQEARFIPRGSATPVDD